MRRLAAASPGPLASTKLRVHTVFTHRNFLSRSKRQACGSSDRYVSSRSNGRSMGLVPDDAKWKHWCSRQPIVLTLSCKSRPPRRPPSGGAAAAATNMQWREPTAAGVTPACSSEPPEGGSAAEPGLGGFCQLVRAVRPDFARNESMFYHNRNFAISWSYSA